MAGDQKKFEIAMMHADRFSQAGKWPEAIKAYRFAMAEFPNSEAAIIGFGQAAFSLGQLDLAQKAYRQALKINPTHLKALNLMADIQERLGQLDAAAETYLRMGNVYASTNELDKAIDSWIRATKLTSGHVNAHLKIADGLAQQGKIRRAAREYLTLAAMYQRRNDQEQAKRHVEAAQQLLPDDPGIDNAFEALRSGTIVKPQMIADAPPKPRTEEDSEAPGSDELSEDDSFADDDLFVLDELDEADDREGGLLETAHRKALEDLANLAFEDTNSSSTMLIVQALDLQRNGSTDDAINTFQQAVSAGADYPALFFNLGLLYREQGQLNEATEMLERSVEDQQYTTSSHFGLGLVYNAAGRLDLAAKNFVEALRTIDLQTVSGQKYYTLVQTYDKLAESFAGQAEADKVSKFAAALQRFFSNPNWEQKVYEARQRMNKVAEEGELMSLAEFLETPETEVVITTLAETSEHLRNELLMTALEECLRGIQEAPTFLPLHSRLADILLKQKHMDHAITKYLYIATVYQMRHQPDQAVNVYRKILNLAPMDVTVRSKLIDLYISSDNIPQALEQYLVLADSYYQLAQVERSIEKYSEALRLASGTNGTNQVRTKILSRMADIYNQRFDWSHATSMLEQLLEIEPNNERVLRQLVDLYYKQNKLSQATTTLDKLVAIYQRQNPRKVLELLKELSSFYPNDLYLRQQLAVAYAQNSMNREAIAVYDELGEMQLEKGLRDQAIQTIQAIINLGPDDVEGYRRLLSQLTGGVP